MIRQVTYISTARTPVPTALLQEIEGAAQRNNARRHLSGLLLFDAVRFLQVLEGPVDAVNATFATIRADSRHLGMVILRDRMVEKAGFPGWAMLCRDVTGAQDLTILVKRYMDSADKTTRALFESFAQLRAN